MKSLSIFQSSQERTAHTTHKENVPSTVLYKQKSSVSHVEKGLFGFLKKKILWGGKKKGEDHILI